MDPPGRHAEQDFMAVILVGYGENLYPFNQGTSVLPKALLPVGNSPVIDLVLDWILAAGIKDILIIVPPVFHSAVSDHLLKDYSDSVHPTARIDLKTYADGEKEEADGLQEGTARLLKRFRSHIKNDFILLPCDISPHSLSLSSILDKHRATPEAVLTAVFYEPVESVGDAEKVLVAYDNESDDLLLIQPLEALEEDFAMRMGLLHAHPKLSLTTRLLDAHVYICRRTVLDLLAERRPKDLDSMKEQVVPWLVKGSWQRGLRKKWAPILSRRDPFAQALARSTPSPMAFKLDVDETSTVPWRCQIVTSGKGIIRANTLAGYWELNRRFLRIVSPSLPDDASIASSAQISPDSLVGEGARVGERASIKKSIVGRHCNIGRGAKLTGCVLWDFVTVEENARIENAILCSNVRIGEKAQIKDCEFGTGFESKAGAVLKGERLIVGQE